MIAWGDAVQELDYTGSTAVITAPAVTLVNDEAYSGTIQYSYTAQGSNEWMGGLPSGIGVYTVKAMIAEQDNYTAAESEEMTLAIQCSHIHTELRNQKKATCTQEGYSGDTYCKECGTLVKKRSENRDGGAHWRQKDMYQWKNLRSVQKRIYGKGRECP